MSEISTFISSVGFPIAATIFLSIYVVRKDKAAQQQLQQVTQTLTEAHRKEADKLAEVIERNTAAFEDLSRKVDSLSRKIKKE